MRVITGLYKGRHFDVPRSFKARPTTDFAKENIFNVVKGYIDLEDTMALDLLQVLEVFLWSYFHVVAQRLFRWKWIVIMRAL